MYTHVNMNVGMGPCVSGEDVVLPISVTVDRLNVCGWPVREGFWDVDVSLEGKMEVSTLRGYPFYSNTMYTCVGQWM